MDAHLQTISAINDAKKDYKPANDSRSAWDLAHHIAICDVGFLQAVASNSFANFPAKCDAKNIPELANWYKHEMPKALEKVMALDGKNDGHLTHGLKPCIGQRQANGTYALVSVSQAYGCTEPYFLIREAFQRRTAMSRYDEFRRPGMFMLDMNFAKTTPITKGVRLQIRLEAFNLLNTTNVTSQRDTLYNFTGTALVPQTGLANPRLDFGADVGTQINFEDTQRIVQIAAKVTF